ncbi:MAG: hypothetical protein JXB46_08360 [Candidatus Eisenbacteria bacterium]|nr:hypothetical protein [Candidatus Eisenbacteria bacterium]
MMSFRRLSASALAVALIGVPLAAMLFLTGCRKQEQVFVDSNIEPNTSLTRSPLPAAPDNAPTNYRVHMYWEGTDPDGYVVAFHFAWDDTVPPYGAPNSPWYLTSRGDSLFKALIDTIGETKRHTFYVRAVDNEGKLDPTPARIRFDASTDRPVIEYLYRVGGTEDPDPNNPNYEPGKKDTVLMRSYVTFKWDGYDPDGLGAPVTFSYRLDSNTDEPFADLREITLPIPEPPDTVAAPIRSGTHFFYVKAKDETGAQNFPRSYKFVMNFEPDSQILEPVKPSGTLVVSDGDTIWFRWEAHDREELEGDTLGGVEQIWIELDGDFQEAFAVNETTGVYVNEWYFTSSVPPSNPHYISTDDNNPNGGNRPHVFRIWSKDVEGTFERSSTNLEDRERYVFSYNKPPDSHVIFPAEGDTVCPEFEVLWEGADEDGAVAAYQYVLDPQQNAYRVCQVLPGQECTSREYEVEAGPHQFRVRAQDNAGCWEQSWNIVSFYVAETADTEILSPAEDDVVCGDFTVEWSGTFDGGDIVAYEYVLDPDENNPVICEVGVGEPCTSADYSGIESGDHLFRVRAQDESGCWAWPWTEVEFTVEDCD